MGLTKKSSKKRIKAAWLAALRSGDYKRGEGKLHQITTTAKGKQNHTFCCLGVLCDLAVKAKVIPEGTGAEIVSYGHDTNYPPTSVMNWVGLKAQAGIFTDSKGDGQSLADKNDNGKTFKKIADIIESNPKGLFV